MEKFEFFFGVELGRKVLNITDNLSRLLQSKTISACEGQNLVRITLTLFQTMRSDMSFTLFWKYLEHRRISIEVSPPTLPRHRKIPRRFETDENTPEYQTTAEQHYNQIYFRAIDLSVEAIKVRFDQKGFQMLKKLEVMLTNETLQCSNVIKDVMTFYGNDFDNAVRVETQLSLMHSSGTSMADLKSIITYLKSLSNIEKAFYSEVVKIVKLILAMPATNATSERSFSALRRLKTWLRATSSQARLNWCMILHVHKDRTDALSLKSVANEFVVCNESRMRLFGKFPEK